MTGRPAIPGFNGSAAEAASSIDRWAQGFAEKAQRYREAQADTEQLRLSATSSDGRVRVTVGADGGVTGLRLDERLRELPMSEVAERILTTMRQAQSGIADRVGEVMAAHLGDEDLHTRATMMTMLRDRFPEEPEPEPEAPPERRFESADEPLDEPGGRAGTAPPPLRPARPAPEPPRRPRRPPAGPDDLDDGVDETHDPLRD